MKLWLLRPIETGDFTPWEINYNCNFGYVICAKSEERARILAQENGGKETYDDDVDFDDPDFEKIPAWTDPKWSTCVELKPEMFEEEEIIIYDYKNFWY